MKNTEIERKFLVSKDNLPDLSKRNYMDVSQGYIQNIGSNYIYRLRQVLHMSPNGYSLGEQYFQTIKGFGLKVREEYEIELLRPQYHQLWPLCKNISIHKYRYEIAIEGCEYEAYLDVYKNEFEGLITVEVEFKNEAECDSFVPLSWFGREVTHEKEYTNFSLSINGLPKDLV
jgi:adenylate cyclase